MSYMKWLIPASNYVGWWTGKWSIYPRRIFTLDRFLGFVHFLKPESQDLQCYWLRNTSRGHNYLRIFSFPNLTIPLHYLLWRNGQVAGFCTERFRCEVHFGKILYSHAINLSEGLLQSVWRRRVGGGVLLAMCFGNFPFWRKSNFPCCFILLKPEWAQDRSANSMQENNADTCVSKWGFIISRHDGHL